ncbi:hypothetical protein [Alkalibacillus aidingensis]|uniref:hypothetical protein n=1 Tax=Alkalibacillus aidingensis TaxID=2747607 RepID=UPI0016612C8F|nr:hypothetical protein [Alkalibacillus aidingensis]
MDFIKLDQTVQFLDEKFSVNLCRYVDNNNFAILLKNENGEVMATTNVTPLIMGFVTIKNYSENAGIEQSLINANIITNGFLRESPKARGLY